MKLITAVFASVSVALCLALTHAHGSAAITIENQSTSTPSCRDRQTSFDECASDAFAKTTIVMVVKRLKAEHDFDLTEPLTNGFFSDDARIANETRRDALLSLAFQFGIQAKTIVTNLQVSAVTELANGLLKYISTTKRPHSTDTNRLIDFINAEAGDRQCDPNPVLKALAQRALSRIDEVKRGLIRLPG